MKAGRAVAAGTIVGIVIIVTGIWMTFSPQWTLKQLRDAAQAGDAQTISAHIDYEALRRSVKQNVADSLAQTTGGGTASRVLALALLSGQIDKLITPEAMTAMIQGRQQAGGATDGIAAGDVSIERTSLRTFTAGKPGSGGGIEFTLEGLTWRVTGIHAKKVG